MAALLGGHWGLLQSVAWARMLSDYAQRDSLAVAVGKTFDGDHPCPMCLKIQEKRKQERETPVSLSWRAPKFVPQAFVVAAPLPPVLGWRVVGFVRDMVSDFTPSLPRPVPRSA